MCRNPTWGNNRFLRESRRAVPCGMTTSDSFDGHPTYVSHSEYTADQKDINSDADEESAIPTHLPRCLSSSRKGNAHKRSASQYARHQQFAVQDRYVQILKAAHRALLQLAKQQRHMEEQQGNYAARQPKPRGPPRFGGQRPQGDDNRERNSNADRQQSESESDAEDQSPVRAESGNGFCVSDIAAAESPVEGDATNGGQDTPEDQGDRDEAGK